MADLFSVTAPLAIRFADGTKQIMIERIPFRNGILFLPPWWTDHSLEHSLRFVAGPIKGDGPWKSGDAVITVLGCHGTDPELAREFSCWQSEREQMAGYPAREEVQRLMREHAPAVARA